MVRRALIGAVGALLLIPAGASGCTIAGGFSPYEKVQRSDLAVYGRVVAVHWLRGKAPHGAPGRRYAVDLRVLRVFKGHPGRVIRLVGHTNGGLCGRAPPQLGVRLGLLLEGKPPYGFGLGTEISLADLQTAKRGPPPPTRPPPPDRRAGRPAYLARITRQAATEETYLVALDRRGRVVRSLGHPWEHLSVCPGGRRFAASQAWAGGIFTFAVSGQVRRRKLSLPRLEYVTCLDARARTVATVTRDTPYGEDSRATLRLYSGSTRRTVLTVDGEVTKLDRSGMYVSDDTGVSRYDITTGRLLQRVGFPAYPLDLRISPGRRWWAATTYPESGVSRDVIVDALTGQAVPLRSSVVGWISTDRLLVAGGRLRVIDHTAREIASFSGLASDVLVFRGRAVVLRGRSMFEVSRTGTSARLVGQVPPATDLIAALD